MMHSLTFVLAPFVFFVFFVVVKARLRADAVCVVVFFVVVNVVVVVFTATVFAAFTALIGFSYATEQAQKQAALDDFVPVNRRTQRFDQNSQTVVRAAFAKFNYFLVRFRFAVGRTRLIVIRRLVTSTTTTSSRGW